MDKLRKKLAALEYGGCDGCVYTCGPPDKTLCPADLDQVIPLFEEENKAEEEHTSHLVDDVIRLEEELRVGNDLVIKLTERCRWLEYQQEERTYAT